MIVIGIDPGASGALALFTPDAGVLDVLDMPTTQVKVNNSMRARVSEAMLAELLRARVEGKQVHAVLEQVNPRPGEGAAGAFAFGTAFGAMRGVLAGLRIPMTLVSPATWTRDLKVGSDKGTHRAKAAQLFPAYAASFARVKDDGRADAALIAYWGFVFGRVV